MNGPAKGLNREWTACTRCGNTNVVVTAWLYQTRGTKLGDNHERPSEFVHLSNLTAYVRCACSVCHYRIFGTVSNFLGNWPCAISTILAPLFLWNLHSVAVSSNNGNIRVNVAIAIRGVSENYYTFYALLRISNKTLKFKQNIKFDADSTRVSS